ncbi:MULTISPECIES: NAD(P)H-hydrate dehydratase [unclassified Enterococcus]|uniref:NAD(P)H-hydrate dehydratase n=1 Tax=unclassified Enterococcus TaxID=2608891 RepID=UPI00155545FB|nr:MULTISPECIES: NAD(P)H-hydrate dehydratase [unclassified Enterococcus]MBS7577393.1 NAD(P)H-hydrate dehydratase [Enterococcus sp. MMGLQ5-2]MBS7584800.1 NAD(P)H-hydrate dehydratase [Enterococcus sp. MMGLQ5-1]NPD12655.1 NAD(P)H-hydrate dehydratase [Enterococcus sp. MMGLQ5-1]NPD37227.1 NAD(P)H-hydrate dehydratase [Enterococcus sp. MMGLQ5-2]
MRITKEILYQLIQKRPLHSHKGTFGHALLIGGAPQYSGAIIMAATACLYSGAGLTTVATSAETRLPLLSRSPEAMVIDWTSQDSLTLALQKATVILIGPGLAEDQFALSLLEFVLKQIKQQRLIIDASAINLIAANRYLFKLLPENTIFTPQQKELERLTKIPIAKQKPSKIQAFAEDTNTIIIAKSEKTTIYSAGRAPHYIDIGTPAMATGGTGDTLAGILTGLLAQFSTNCFSTACAAVYLHSEIASDLAQSRYLVLPTQISEQLPFYLYKYSR